MMDLKSRFELSRELPSNQERLSWELPRFLDAASRRGKIIVVIDGLHRIANNDDSEANLAWLPLVLPPGVRFIISASDITTSRKPKPVVVGAPAAPSPKSQLLTERSGTFADHSSRAPSPANGETAQAGALKSSNKDGMTEMTSPRRSMSPAVGAGAGAGPGYHQVGDDDSDCDSEELRAQRNIRGRRIMAELERRQLTGLDMKPMDRPTCRSMLEAYVRKSVQTAVAAAHAARGDSENFPAIAMAMGTFLTNMHGSSAASGLMVDDDMDAEMDSFLSGLVDSPLGNDAPGSSSPTNPGSAQGIDFVPGFLLFESQINALLSHSQGSTPLFLRLILRCAHNAVARGFSLWFLWDDWLKATSVSELLERILLTLEKGHAPTAQSMADDEARTLREGGLAALVRLYPWHPSLRRVHRRAQETADRQRKHEAREAQLAAEHGSGSYPPAGTYPLSTSIGPTSSDDSAQLEQLIAASKPAVALNDEGTMTPTLAQNSLSDSTSASVAEGSPALFRPESLSLDSGPVLHLAAPLPPASLTHSLVASTHTLSSGGTAAAHMGMGVTKGAGTSILQSLGDQQWLSASQHAETRLDEALRTAERGVDKAMFAAKRAAAASSTASGASHWCSPDGQSAEAEAGAGAAYIDVMMHTVLANAHAYASVLPPSGRAGHSPTALLQSLQAESESAKTLSSSANSPSQLLGPASTLSLDASQAQSQSQRQEESRSLHFRSGKESSSIDVEAMLVQAQLKEIQDQYTEPEDPVEAARVGLSSLPVYLRGGLVSQGLGALLGNALSLLFVARHGLKEAELWAMLATLRARPPEYMEMLQRQRVQQEKSRGVLQVCHAARGDLEDHWRVEDHVRTGMLTLAQLQRGMLKASKALRRGDLLRLLEITGLVGQEAVDAGFVTGTEDKVNEAAHDAGPEEGAGAGAAIRVYFPELLHRILSGEKRERWHTHRHRLGLFHEHEHIGLGGKVTDGPKAIGGMDDFAVGSSSASRSPYGPQAFSRRDVPFGEEESGDGYGDLGSAAGSVLGSQDDLATLGPVIEENLLELLTSLGALHSPEHQVILLPSENHSFRTVIRAIVEQRGGEEAWHGHMIRYFQKLPNTSMRRCEELPWHLQLCRKWYVLKDALSDLKTFDMMYTSDDLKDELLSYWRLLTEGPLRILSEAQLQQQVAEQLAELERDKAERRQAEARARREGRGRRERGQSSQLPSRQSSQLQSRQSSQLQSRSSSRVATASSRGGRDDDSEGGGYEDDEDELYDEEFEYEVRTGGAGAWLISFLC